MTSFEKGKKGKKSIGKLIWFQ